MKRRSPNLIPARQIDQAEDGLPTRPEMPIFFLQGPAGAGKTFLYCALTIHIHWLLARKGRHLRLIFRHCRAAVSKCVDCALAVQDHDRYSLFQWR